jgi:hypothetical protein
VANLDWLVRTSWVRRAATSTRVGELWLRDPSRFQYLVLLAFAGLAGYGLQAWLDARREGLRPALWFVPSVAVFALWPMLAGSAVGRYAVFAAATLILAPVLVLAGRRTRWAPAVITVLVAVELTTAALIGQAGAVHQLQPVGPARFQVPGSHRPQNAFGAVLGALERPVIHPATYLTPGAIGRALMANRSLHGRYLTFDPAIAAEPRGFLLHQDPASWPAYEDGRSILFGIDEAQGYLSVQLVRYWRLVRRLDPRPIFYNAATLQTAPPAVLDVFGVRWLILPRGQPSPAPGREVASEGRFVLEEVSEPAPRASVVFRWEVVSPGPALAALLGTGFDPRNEALVERAPQIDGRPLSRASGSVPPRWSAVYSETSPQDVRIEVTTAAPGLLVVRNAFDAGWHATVDGRPAPTLAADDLVQAVAVPAGAHVVELTYRDPWIGVGLLISGIAWALLAAWIGVLVRRARRSRHARGVATQEEGLAPPGVPVTGPDASSS